MIHKNWQELIKPTQLDVKPGNDPARQATVVAEPLEPRAERVGARGPALEGGPLTILLLMPILGGDELRLQHQHPALPSFDNHRRTIETLIATAQETMEEDRKQGEEIVETEKAAMECL